MQIDVLIARIKSKDQQAFAHLYDQYSGSLMGVIVRILGNKEAAEEVLQKTMLKVWNNIDSYNEAKSSLYTWMAAIARNSAIDVRRLKSFQNNEKTESIDNSVYQVAGNSINTSELDVEKLTARLDPKHKQVLDHVYLMGYTHQEASDKLGIPLGTIKTRLRLAIKALREELKSEKGLFLGLLIILLILLML
ncbi:MAG: RNA polymerase sigma factor [Saprospiraceae bacterium]